MKLIQNKSELIKNIETIEDYLNGSLEDVRNEMAQYISRGRVLIAYRIDGEFHFAPSRFIGYAQNSIKKHLLNEEKDGKETTPAISRILGARNMFSQELEDAYSDYCHELGVKTNNYKRTYWTLDEKDCRLLPAALPSTEGRRRLVTHILRERNRRVVDEAKERFKLSHNGRLFCEICGFDFQSVYGKLGEGFIEAHHKVPLSEKVGEHSIEAKDFLMVCSNCHSILHRNDTTIQELKSLIHKNQ